MFPSWVGLSTADPGPFTPQSCKNSGTTWLCPFSFLSSAHLLVLVPPSCNHRYLSTPHFCHHQGDLQAQVYNPANKPLSSLVAATPRTFISASLHPFTPTARATSCLFPRNNSISDSHGNFPFHETFHLPIPPLSSGLSPTQISFLPSLEHAVG